MTATEAILIGLLSLSLLQSFLGDGSRVVSLTFVAGALVLTIIHVFTHHLRWQMFPVYLVVASLSVMILWGIQPAGVLSYLGVATATVLLLLSVALTLGLPVKQLPAPDGPLGVGMIAVEKERVVKEGSGEEAGAVRRLLVKVWYPAEPNIDQGKYVRETLWSEFYRGGEFSAWVRVLAGYLRNVRTHSFEGAPIRAGDHPYPIIVYNHGLVSIGAENTLLMESLASNGYIVLSIRHRDQHAEYVTIQQRVPEEERAKNRALNKRLGESLAREERSLASLQLFQQSTGMRTIVERRTADSEFVMDNMDSVLTPIPGCAGARCADMNRIGALGLSLGGAVASELCRTERRCRAVANLDGGLYGGHILDPINVPYLMIYSEHNAGSNDFLRQVANGGFEDHVVSGTKHLNFHDASVVLPVLRWIGALGKRSGLEVNTQVNRRVCAFFNKGLRAH